MRIYILLFIFLLCGCVKNDEPTPKEVFQLYFKQLSEQNYHEIIKLYGGSYELLISSNPNIDPNNHEELFKAYCTINGGQIVRIDQIISETKISEDEYLYKVTFLDKEGKSFRNGKEYEYRVKKVNSIHKVLTLPPYLS